MLKDTLNHIIFEDLKFIISQNIPWTRLQDKTLLVTGANGFLPSYIIYSLLYLNDAYHLNLKVIALARNKSHAEKRFSNELGRKDFSLLIQDVCDPVQSNDKTDFIIHAASQASPKYYSTDPVGTLNANILGTNNLLNHAYKNSVESFMFFSSSEVYGIVDEQYIPTKESNFGFLDPSSVRSCYAESKRMGETMCVSWMHQFGVPVKMVRPFHTYGPGIDLEDKRVYADFISDIVNNRDIRMKSDGSAIRAFCYLADATSGFFTVLLKGIDGEAYNVGNANCEISILGLAEKLVKLFPEKKLKVIRQEERDKSYLKSAVSRNSPDITKINSLGWFPNTGIEEGFYKTIKSYE